MKSCASCASCVLSPRLTMCQTQIYCGLHDPALISSAMSGNFDQNEFNEVADPEAFYEYDAAPSVVLTVGLERFNNARGFFPRDYVKQPWER